jgi:hypothetical protein
MDERAVLWWLAEKLFSHSERKVTEEFEKI